MYPSHQFKKGKHRKTMVWVWTNLDTSHEQVDDDKSNKLTPITCKCDCNGKTDLRSKSNVRRTHPVTIGSGLWWKDTTYAVIARPRWRRDLGTKSASRRLQSRTKVSCERGTCPVSKDHGLEKRPVSLLQKAIVGERKTCHVLETRTNKLTQKHICTHTHTPSQTNGHIPAHKRTWSTIVLSKNTKKTTQDNQKRLKKPPRSTPGDHLKAQERSNTSQGVKKRNLLTSTPVKVTKRLPKELRKTHGDPWRPLLNSPEALPRDALVTWTKKTWFFWIVHNGIHIFEGPRGSHSHPKTSKTDLWTSTRESAQRWKETPETYNLKKTLFAPGTIWEIPAFEPWGRELAPHIYIYIYIYIYIEREREREIWQLRREEDTPDPLTVPRILCPCRVHQHYRRNWNVEEYYNHYIIKNHAH